LAGSDKKVCKAGGLPLAIIAVFSFGVKTVNYLRFGLFASTEFNSSGYKAAYRALLRINPPHPVRFVPVTSEVRKMAYQESPALRELAGI